MGKPYDVEEQRSVMGLALDVLEKAYLPRTTVQAPLVWDDSEAWRANFMKVDDAAAGQAVRRRRGPSPATGRGQEVGQGPGGLSSDLVAMGYRRGRGASTGRTPVR